MHEYVLGIVELLSALFQSKWLQPTDVLIRTGMALDIQSCEDWKWSTLEVPFNSSSLWDKWPLCSSVDTWETKERGQLQPRVETVWDGTIPGLHTIAEDIQGKKGKPGTCFLAGVGEWQCLLKERGLGWLSQSTNHFCTSATFPSTDWGQWIYHTIMSTDTLNIRCCSSRWRFSIRLQVIIKIIKTSSTGEVTVTVCNHSIWQKSWATYT